MRIIIQKVKESSVKVDDEIVGQIKKGFLLLVGIETGDEEADIQKAADKIASMRIFEDDNGKMNLSIFDVGGEILSVSQFTLAANVQKGNRPSFTGAMRPEQANEYFMLLNQKLRDQGLKVETGKFQEHMEVSLINDGPVTIILDIKDGKVL